MSAVVGGGPGGEAGALERMDPAQDLLRGVRRAGPGHAVRPVQPGPPAPPARPHLGQRAQREVPGRQHPGRGASTR